MCQLLYPFNGPFFRLNLGQPISIGPRPITGPVPQENLRGLAEWFLCGRCLPNYQYPSTEGGH